MDRWPLTLVLAIALVVLIIRHRQPHMLKRLKERYSALMAYIKSPENMDDKWDKLKTRAILTGLLRHDRSKGAIAFNINKGYEICICLRGNDLEAATYVLLHELAHMTVTEYDHTKKFWKNFRELKTLAADIGVFHPTGGVTTYCGDNVTMI